jgi:uracil-DNA glycosylase
MSFYETGQDQRSREPMVRDFSPSGTFGSVPSPKGKPEESSPSIASSSQSGLTNSQKIEDINELQSLLSSEWLSVIGDEFSKSYWHNIIDILNNENKYLPEKKYIFSAFNNCPPGNVKVVIVGQDPYINSNEPHGLSFSVKPGVRIPPSLRTIFEELCMEYGMGSLPKNGCLLPWTTEGVLLLNSVLTVREGKSDSHKGIGWENFTSSVIKYIDTHNVVVFMAWGAKAQKVCSENVKNNTVLTAGHPSPLNRSRPFKGCGCFREANSILMKNKLLPVRWILLWK